MEENDGNDHSYSKSKNSKRIQMMSILFLPNWMNIDSLSFKTISGFPCAIVFYIIFQKTAVVKKIILLVFP